jgi:hypothetical protein
MSDLAQFTAAAGFFVFCAFAGYALIIYALSRAAK